jgi:hypothetical protein
VARHDELGGVCVFVNWVVLVHTLFVDTFGKARSGKRGEKSGARGTEREWYGRKMDGHILYRK